MKICEDCAREKGIIDNMDGISEDAAWFLHGLFEEIPGKPAGMRSCPVCGTRLRDIRTSRRVGCSACYDIFSREIRKMLRLKDGERPHRGKLPKSVLSYKTFFIDRENLKIELELALDNEDYETAARLRDKIIGLDAAVGKDGA
ncbi:MAG: UvrB/UvrC motif-containing protein [Spirochaetia bacterium]|jgi:protein arginine kinase activator|nr:UvrB/UvrC motif-containing protein [Spirochaetia bacterium]